jgi:hypothetical protein
MHNRSVAAACSAASIVAFMVGAIAAMTNIGSAGEPKLSLYKKSFSHVDGTEVSVDISVESRAPTIEEEAAAAARHRETRTRFNLGPDDSAGMKILPGLREVTRTVSKGNLSVVLERTAYLFREGQVADESVYDAVLIGDRLITLERNGWDIYCFEFTNVFDAKAHRKSSVKAVAVRPQFKQPLRRGDLTVIPGSNRVRIRLGNIDAWEFDREFSLGGDH